jgi:multicomponent Na+:H+ antiporter subunit E
MGLVVMLAAFWLLLSGHVAPLFLFFGAASVLLVAWLARRLDIADDEGRPLQLSLRAPGYWLWLAVQILRSALVVMRRIWSPRLSIDPAVGAVAATAMTDVERVIYANSITLTPGTLALHVDDTRIEVHALERGSLEELAQGAMAARVRQMDLA